MLSHTSPQTKSITAYFCAEFALKQDLPIYSGGLGVLAGDVIRRSDEQNLPVIGIGLFYRQGYFHQEITDVGLQSPHYADIDPIAAGLKLVTTANGPLHIVIPHASEPITAQVWKYQHGNIPMYFLDTNVAENTHHRDITKRLYDPNTDTRIKQEMVLGIGGTKLLSLLDIHPTIYHLNEGHSAFAAFELAADMCHRQEVSFMEALQHVKDKIVFTNHTVVPAGNDIFGKHQVIYNLRAYAEYEGIPINEMVEAGAELDSDETFSMTILALNSSHKANTVSKLHHQIARTVWPDYHFYSVTNGVHLPYWIAPNIQAAVPALDNIGLNRLEPANLWDLHQQNKTELLHLVAKTSGRALHPDALTIVWARRFAGYKRADLVLQDAAQLKKLTTNKQIQIIFAGKAHPSDEIGQETIATINRQIRLHRLEDSVVFLPGYSLDVAKVLVAGADIWLNTPRRSQEASGTSGMKSGANGVLQLSISDGWMDEVSWDDTAWILPEEQTDHAIYTYLNTKILPLYHQRNAKGMPEEWVDKMLQTMHIIWPRFSAARMVKEYQELLYQK